jgi:transposase-like protein
MSYPPFCPNPSCLAHGKDGERIGWRFWVRNGFYDTKVVGPVRRFVCIHCGKGFSERTFALDYFAKKTLDYREILRATNASESVSSIARALSCSEASIQNRQDRLGRNCLAIHERLMEG